MRDQMYDLLTGDKQELIKERDELAKDRSCLMEVIRNHKMYEPNGSELEATKIKGAAEILKQDCEIGSLKTELEVYKSIDPGALISQQAGRIHNLESERDDYRKSLEQNHNNGYLCQWLIDPKLPCNCSHRTVLDKWKREEK